MRKFFVLLIATIFGLANIKANHQHDKVRLFARTKKADNIEKFWNWFKENEKQLRKFEENPDKYLTELLIQAKKIRKGLAIELEPPKNGIINMTVSADGDRELFDIVQQIVAKSPKIEGWNFIAFRQRMSPDIVSGMKLKADDHELDPVAMKFFPVTTSDTLDLIIYVNGVTEENYNQVAYGGLLLLDNILGEYDCVTKVRSYDFHIMPVSKDELKDLRPLLELPAFVDEFHRPKK